MDKEELRKTIKKAFVLLGALFVASLVLTVHFLIQFAVWSCGLLFLGLSSSNALGGAGVGAGALTIVAGVVVGFLFVGFADEVM